MVKDGNDPYALEEPLEEEKDDDPARDRNR